MVGEGGHGLALAILALKNERTRNLNRSSSVCSTTSAKLDFGSSVPVISSIVSIYTGRGQYHHNHTLSPLPFNGEVCLTCAFTLSITRSMRPVG